MNVAAVPPDWDGLRGLVRRCELFGEPVSAAIESMNGARFVHDHLEELGWEVEIADAQKVKGWRTRCRRGTGSCARPSTSRPARAAPQATALSRSPGVGAKISSVTRIVAMSLLMVAVVAGSVPIALAASSSSTPITQAQAVAFAQAVNLKASHLPGARGLPEEAPSEERPDRWARPPRRVRRPVAAEASGLLIAQGFVASIVRVMRTEALAEDELSGVNSRRTRLCEARSLRADFTVDLTPPGRRARLRSSPLKSAWPRRNRVSRRNQVSRD